MVCSSYRTTCTHLALSFSHFHCIFTMTLHHQCCIFLVCTYASKTLTMSEEYRITLSSPPSCSTPPYCQIGLMMPWHHSQWICNTIQAEILKCELWYRPILPQPGVSSVLLLNHFALCILNILNHRHRTYRPLYAIFFKIHNELGQCHEGINIFF